MPSTMQIGQAANLLFGYRAVWEPEGSVPLPFFAPPTESVKTSAPDFVPPKDPRWGRTPTITVHGSAEDLLSAIYHYRVTRLTGDPAGVDVPPGPLALDDADRSEALAAAGAFLGLDLKADQSYMLATMERVSGIAGHAFTAEPSARDRGSYLTPAATTAIGELRPAAKPDKANVLYDSKITEKDARAYLQTIGDLGTHFVSQITAGDLLLQVFAYDTQHFRIVQKAFDDEATRQPDGTLAVTGQAAAAWAYYTSEADGSYGFVSDYGDLACLSRDPALGKAVSDGDWANAYVPDGTPSLFAAAQDYQLLQPLQKQVPTGLVLTPLASLISNLLVAGPWDRLVKGGLLQKYGDGVRVPLARQLDYDWSDVFPEAVESWASNIITPRIDIYQERVDLAKVDLRGGQIVSESFPMKSFTSFSQVLQATTQPGDPPIELPSPDVSLAAQIIDMTEAVQTPVIKLSTKAFDRLTVVCEDMYGSLIFQEDAPSDPRRKVALDGFLFQTLPQPDPKTGRFQVGLSGVLSDKPSPELVSRLSQSIQFSVVAGESLLHSRGPNAETVRALERAYLLWLASIIPADTQDAGLAHDRARALYLAHDVGTFGSDVVYVPYVTYETYSKYVGDMVSQAKTLNSEISSYQIRITDTINSYKVMDSIDNLNYNIKQIGGVLTSYFKVLADGRKAMDKYYDAVIGELDKELEKTLEDIGDLQKKLQEQQEVISHTGTPQGVIQKFEQDYTDYTCDLVAQAVFSGVEALFSLGLSMAAIPSEAKGGVLKALKAIKDVVDKLQAVMKVLKQLAAIEKAVGNISKVNELADSISIFGAKGELQMPSQVDLQLMGENVRAALANVPDKGSLNQDKAYLIAAVDSLVIVGSALVEAQIKASQILVEIANTNRLKTINGEQEKQLDGLSNKLHLRDTAKPPDVASIDLIGVTGRLQYQLKQVLKVLAQILELQDGAIQFQYFGEPTAVTSFTLLNLQAVISAQDSHIINALQQLDPPPQKVNDPIRFTIPDVQVKKLSGGNVFELPIHLCATELYDYDMVRIDRVVPRIKGIKSTDSGNYEVHLSCQAKPFQDRDYQRRARTFATARRKFGPYVYDVATGKAEFGTNTGTFADQVTHLTPFALWQVSLPADVRNNQGIEFDGLLVDVELDFHITAHYDDPARRRQALARVAELAAIPEAAGAGDTDAPSLANLEAQMYQNQAVLQRWDAVFNVLEGPVNAFLYQQFQQYVSKLDPNNSDNLMTITAFYCDGVQPFHGEYFTNVTKMSFKLSNPLLQFVAGNDTVTVVQDILSGSVVTGTLVVTETGFEPSRCHLVEGDVDFTADPSTDTLTLSVDGVFESNMQVKLKTTGTLPAPLQPDQDYWVIGWASSGGKTTLQLSDQAKGSAIDLSDAGSGTHTIYADVDWGQPNRVDVSKKPYVKASVALAKVSGIVTPPDGQGPASETHTVVLDFPKGAFTLNRFQVDPPNWDPDHHATQISNALANFYATHEIEYQVQTINYTDLSHDEALQPTKFVLNAVKTNAGNSILQILIATTGQVQHAHTITLNEPIPYDPTNPIPGQSDFMVSLMIGTKLMFGHIFVDSFNRGGTNLEIEAVDPGKDFKAWSAKISHGSATGTVKFDNPYYQHGKFELRVSASGNDLSWSLAGLEFQRSSTAGVTLAYSNGDATVPSGGTTVGFQARYWYPPTRYSPGSWGSWMDYSAVAYINMSGGYPLEVTGSGREQLVKFTTVEPTVHFDKSSDLKPTGACECNDNDLKIALLDELGDAVPKTLRSYMEQITFKPISVFALESLLFPAEQLITMQQARVPGDLLVVGSFLAQVRKKSSSYDVTISAASGAKGELGGVKFQNGEGTGSATKKGLPAQFQFSYGPIDPALGGMVTYTVDIEKGTVSPPLILVVDQPDPDGKPAEVILLPPGYPSTG